MLINYQNQNKAEDEKLENYLFKKILKTNDAAAVVWQQSINVPMLQLQTYPQI